MFLIAITRNKISNNFQPFEVEQIKTDSSTVTFVTDNSLSKCIQKPRGFSIVESPLISSASSRNLILSEITYNRDANLLTLSKPTTSGRSIYYHINSKGDFFCSSHISMLRKAGVPIQENTEVLPEYFVYSYIMPPQTLYKNIKRMPPGGHLCVKLAAGKCETSHINKYNPPEPNRNNNNIADASTHTLDFLSKSIEALSPCKNRTAVLFSGGLDSSILFKLCQTKYQINTTFSTGYPFEDPNNNLEKDYALSAANAFGTKHRYYQVTTNEYLRGFLESIQVAEEPLNHLQSPLLYLLFKGGLPQDKDIVVSGLGADDIFGIALHSSVFNREKRSRKMIFKLLSRQPLKKLLELISHTTGRGRGFLNYLEKLPISAAENIIWSLGAYGSEDWVCRYFNVTKQDIIRGRYDYIKQFEKRSIYDIISLLAFLGSCSFTQSIWGKLGESQRKNLYYPFCDMDMQNYIYSIPWEVKLESPKYILRGVAHQLKIPDFIISRPKSAFGVQAKFWSGKGGTFEPLVPLASKVFDEKQIRKMQSAGPKNPITFWNILNYSIWKRLCINKESLTTLLEELQEININQGKDLGAAAVLR